MDNVQSFKGYGKVDDKDRESARKDCKRIIILTVSVLLLTVLIVGALVGTIIDKNHKKHDSDDSNNASADSSETVIRSICSVTQYPESCYASLESSNSTDPEKIFQLSLHVVMDSLNKLMQSFPEEYTNKTEDPMVKEAMSVCGTVLDDAVYTLNESISEARHVLVDDLKTWLSTVLTDQETCLDAVEEVNATFADDVRSLMKNSSEYASNSLAIVSEIIEVVRDFFNENVQVRGRRRRLLGDFPTWVAHGDRRLLQADWPKPNVKVAADGSGDVKTLSAAVAKIPKKSKKRFVIYVKAGVYKESVVLSKNHWNVMIYGDGKRKTIISGSKNYVDGTPTFKTATFGVAGKGFMARDIGFRNSAGPQKHQAVAFRSGSDKSVCYLCSFDGFQDTLYVHSNRQFYRECDITGTVDFIFGNSAVVLQNCNIWPRQPMKKQFVTITAQGKKDRNQNTGISIQRCVMRPLDDNLTAKTYLGRPWKDFSTTVVMESNIGGFLDPRGWASWVKNKDPPKSIFYAEYKNRGPGSNTRNRVKWAGYKPKLTRAQASKFNVGSFIQGSSWLRSMGVDFDSR